MTKLCLCISTRIIITEETDSFHSIELHYITLYMSFFHHISDTTEGKLGLLSFQFDFISTGTDIEPIFDSFNIALDRIEEYGRTNDMDE